MCCSVEAFNGNRVAGHDLDEKVEEQEAYEHSAIRSERREQSRFGENLLVSRCELSAEEVRGQLNDSIVRAGSVRMVTRHRGLLEVLDQLVALEWLSLADCLAFYRGRRPKEPAKHARQNKDARRDLRDTMLSESGFPVYICGPDDNRIVVLHPQDTTQLSLARGLHGLQEAWRNRIDSAWQQILCDRGRLALGATTDSWAHGLIRFVLASVLPPSLLEINLPIAHGGTFSVVDQVQQVLHSQAQPRDDAETSANDAVETRLTRLREEVARSDRLINGTYGLPLLFGL
jgi:hypothetical protein